VKILTVGDMLYALHHDRQRLRARAALRRQLIIAAIAIALSAALIAFGQTVEIYTERGVLTNRPELGAVTSRVAGSPGSPTDYVARPTPKPKPKPTPTPKAALKVEAVTPLKP